MQAAYEALPQEFMGCKGRVTEEQGRGRVGVLCLEDFYLGILGRDTVPETDAQWLALPSSRREWRSSYFPRNAP